MNWLILISAGLCEVGFTYCLGRAKEVVGSEWWSWIAAFSFFYVLSAVLLAEGDTGKQKRRSIESADMEKIEHDIQSKTTSRWASSRVAKPRCRDQD